jgi:hypothetical protein
MALPPIAVAMQTKVANHWRNPTRDAGVHAAWVI